MSQHLQRNQGIVPKSVHLIWATNRVLAVLAPSPAAPYCSQCSAPRSHGTTSHQAWGLFHPHCQQHKCLHLRWSLGHCPSAEREIHPQNHFSRLSSEESKNNQVEPRGTMHAFEISFLYKGCVWVYRDAGESCTMCYSCARTIKPALCVGRTKSSRTAWSLAACWAPGTNDCCAGKGQRLLWKLLCSKTGWDIWQSCREWCVASSKAPQGLRDILCCRNAILCP